MKTASVSLNLSRKWRSQNFDQIVGQDLSVRILKNSLYLGHYFPVYLFAGQRGCGKTSTARVFASAVNCERLLEFQKDPKKVSIPCLECSSCNAMQEGKHPDFIEIDAASYTGVDHMRNIIESSSLLPIMGSKRIYLIDEAHMLSKAAFNAALKILEEPPASALFILATTNPHKIIDTVRSRCFQLFFSPIKHNSLVNHLQMICTKESIAHDNEALDLIVRHTQGSARDALNVLEQVRFSSSVVNKNAVLQLLGHVNDQSVVALIKATLSGSVEELLFSLKEMGVEQYAADYLWQRLITVLRALIWKKHGIDPIASGVSAGVLDDVVNICSLQDVYRIVEALYEYEELFLKTPMQHALLEMILLNLCHKDKKKSHNNGNDGSAPCSLTPIVSSEENEEEDDEESTLDSSGVEYAVKPVHATRLEAVEKKTEVVECHVLWGQFVDKIVGFNDPLLNSLFKQAKFVSYDEADNKVVVEIAKDLILFKDWLENARDVWQPLLKKVFSASVLLQAHFTGEHVGIAKAYKQKVPLSDNQAVKPQEKTPPVSVAPIIKEQSFGAQKYYKKKSFIAPQRNEVLCDVSDKDKWKIASMLLRHFPGVVTEIRENQ